MRVVINSPKAKTHGLRGIIIHTSYLGTMVKIESAGKYKGRSFYFSSNNLIETNETAPPKFTAGDQVSVSVTSVTAGLTYWTPPTAGIVTGYAGWYLSANGKFQHHYTLQDQFGVNFGESCLSKVILEVV